MSYELILQAARNRDEASLQTALETSCIDVWKVGFYKEPAITTLAKENDQDAVRWLLEKEAS